MAHDAKGKAQRAWRIAYEDSENSELSNALPYALCALHRIWSIQHRACSIEYRASSIELTDPAHAAGFHLTTRCCQLLFGALLFSAEIRLFDPVIDEIPGEFFVQITFAEDVKIRVYGGCFKGLGPVALVGMGH